ncbi:DNA segregation ATPase, FtsK/SpoIIIE family [Desulfosporosinus orientis DSM 765]|uniref:DNA segregation ATPase, FtsK/SpoIIIE family n=1 Tax=Desulfosporosinus orientis (strain ATCC 19365 / DSM 765 / NCIMB 8382 / VKM B-1628 / Singapore I) TaxID=768706 RepID=G7WDR5_DESOD|nr:DNA translocase FtsK [Desulfosporosinus orientis]AET68822.1 DNA segregation ATPase, FtsK/SpoIIIE family [Desulfosporosinus orientis DSM 765]
MSKKSIKPTSVLLFKLLSIILILVSFLGFLGTFGFSVGKQIYTMFTAVMGSFAWAGPFVSLIIAFFLWHYPSLFKADSPAKSETDMVKDNQRNREKYSPEGEIDGGWNQSPNLKGIPLPTGKLVSLQGFNQYFSSPDWVEVKDQDIEKAEALMDMGKDFPTYFGTGKTIPPKKQSNLTTLKGFNDYFAEVEREPIIVAKTPEIEPKSFSAVFKTKTEQEEFLAQFKEEKTIVEQCPIIQENSEADTVVEEPHEDVQTSQSLESAVSKLVKNEPIPETSALAEEERESDCETSTEFVSKSVKSLDLNLMEFPINMGSTETMLEFEVPPVAAAIELEERPAEKIKEWEFPDFDLLEPLTPRTIIQDPESSRQLEKVLQDFGVRAKVIRVTRGPVITRYELAPAPGVKISKIVNLADDIALGLAARDVRIEAPIPGKAAVGIEVPNKQAFSVPFREVLETSSFRGHPSKLKVALGKDIADQPIIADLIKMPHLLVAGATGSGKSVCITTIINSLLFNAAPDEVKFLLVDPKMVELSQYNGIPHLLAPVVIDPKKAASALKWIVKEMENRYELFASSGVRDIERYNKLKAGETPGAAPALPLIVVIIDELADLMMVAAGEVEEAICRLAQMARAAGIHLVIATQRPSVDVITGVIKANIPSRISFAVSSQIDSRTILDATGAEKLLGRGDMLYSPLGVNKPVRVQGCLVTDDEVQRVINHWKQLGKPEYLDPERLFADTNPKSEEGNGPDDALFFDAGQLFIRTGMASVSFLQRRLKLGYTRAARIMDMLEEQGVVGAYEGSKPRQVLLTLEEFNERFG